MLHLGLLRRHLKLPWHGTVAAGGEARLPPQCACGKGRAGGSSAGPTGFGCWARSHSALAAVPCPLTLVQADEVQQRAGVRL